MRGNNPVPRRAPRRRWVTAVAVAVAAVGTLATVPTPSAGDSRRQVGYAEPGAFLGVQTREETDNPEGGARVTRVVEDSPAERAGLEEGDILVGFGDAVIRGPVALTERIHAHKPGDRVEVRLLRDGKERRVEVELGTRRHGLALLWAPDDDCAGECGPAGPSDGPWLPGAAPDPPDPPLGYLPAPSDGFRVLPRLQWGLWDKPRLGVQLVETTPELRRHLGGSDDAGVLVSKVLSGTPAARAGIEVGDLILAVDGQPVASSAELVEALRDKEGREFGIEVARDRKRRTIQVSIPAPNEDPPTGPRA